MDIFDARLLSLVTEGLKLSKDRFKFGLKITQASDRTVYVRNSPSSVPWIKA